MRKFIVLILQITLLIGLFSCKREVSGPVNTTESFILLYTNDEHGWMEPNLETDGAAGLAGLWKSQEAYDGSDSYLILSGGDMWTGPAISTWFDGESMVEVMNAMDYDAAALGNHEFDFKIDGLIQRAEQMDFPILCANIHNRIDGQIPSFVEPYMMLNINDVKIGILGLANIVTALINFPAVGENFEFTSYTSAIEKYVPVLKNEGADIIIIIGHICDDEMENLAPIAKTHGVSIIGGGHCHSPLLKIVDDVLLIKGGGHMIGYTKVEFSYNTSTDNFQIIKYELVENKYSDPDPEIQSIVEYWQAETSTALAEKIAYCSESINRYLPSMGNLVTDSWLHTFNEADISITNGGGIRQDIPAGDVSKETIVGLLPFNNTILELELTGAELLDCIGTYLLVGGMTTANGNFLSDGTPIQANEVYTVLTTDYLYFLPACNFSTYDSDPIYTSAHYRDPLIDYLKSLNTSEQDPLNNYLDHTPRR